MRHLRAGDGAIESMLFTVDGTSLVCVETALDEDVHHAVHWLDPRTGEHQRTLDLREDAWRRSISYADDAVQTGEAFVSPDGQWVAVRRYLGDPVMLDLWSAK